MKHAGIALIMIATSSVASADEALMTQASKYGFQDTQARLEAVVKEKGLTEGLTCCSARRYAATS